MCVVYGRMGVGGWEREGGRGWERGWERGSEGKRIRGSEDQRMEASTFAGLDVSHGLDCWSFSMRTSSSLAASIISSTCPALTEDSSSAAEREALTASSRTWVIFSTLTLYCDEGGMASRASRVCVYSPTSV